MTELKPCPFCGGEANIRENYLKQTHIGCFNEDCFCRLFANSKKEAIKKWNRRVNNG